MTPQSAQSVYPDSGALPGDHASILRAETADHRTFTTLRRLILDAGSPGTGTSKGTAIRSTGAAVTSTDGESDSSTSALPPYVARKHDADLAERVQQAVAGESVMVMLVGASSTGKTRACWEAVQRLPDNWRLWHPINPDRPEAALAELEQVGPHTVVWLNEAQFYLMPERDGLGERIAAGLRTLLNDGARRPVLVLGTIWPQYYRRLTEEADPDDPADPHNQARELLKHKALAVAPGFSRREVEMIVDAASDPRLLYAAARADDGMITQYLAGAPDLLDRYLTAAAGPRALLNAAMDARRLGHGQALPQSFLASAAEAYLTDTEWDLLPQNWLADALSAVTVPVRGARGALTPVVRARGAVEAPTDAPAYRLADYLEQYGRDMGRVMKDPALFWAAAARECAIDSALELAAAAERHGHPDAALALYKRPDSAVGYLAGAQTLMRRSHVQEALTWYRLAADRGGFPGTTALKWLTKEGLGDEAVDLCVRATRAGNPSALLQAGEWLGATGSVDAALTILEHAVDQGIDHAASLRAQLLLNSGEVDRGLDWYEAAWATGDAAPCFWAAERLGRLGHVDDALTWYRRAADGGKVHALAGAAEMLRKNGRVDEALTWYRRAADAGIPFILQQATEMLEQHNRIDEALAWFERAFEAGTRDALRQAAQLLGRRGMHREALIWFERSFRAGSGDALRHAASMLCSAGPDY